MTNMSGDMVKHRLLIYPPCPKLVGSTNIWIRPCLKKVEEIDGYDVTQQSC